MDDTGDLAGRLDRYVRACNNRRSCQAAASGFVTGRRFDNLRSAVRDQRAALLALTDWVEAQARFALRLPPTPTDTHAA